MTSSDPPSICFVAPHAYVVLSERPDLPHIGGAEVQQVLIAKELVKRGYSVSFVTEDHGQTDGTLVNGVRVFVAYDATKGIPGPRFFHPRITGLWLAMRRADADIYYQRTSDSNTGVVAAFCRWRRRGFVFAAASNADCMAELPHCSTRRERVLYRYGLRRARCVVAQTVVQQRMLQENFGVKSTVVPNFAPNGEALAEKIPASLAPKRVLWIGRFTPDKRPEMLVEIARRCPEVEFDVVGEGDESSWPVQQLRVKARALGNLRLHGRVPHAQVGGFYLRAACLICTSPTEGFPNTFLEAWSSACPVISTFDPDDLIARRELGLVAGDVPGLAAAVRRLLESPDLYRRLSQNARQYYIENHTVEVAMPRFEEVFLGVLNAP